MDLREMVRKLSEEIIEEKKKDDVLITRPGETEALIIKEMVEETKNSDLD